MASFVAWHVHISLADRIDSLFRRPSRPISSMTTFSTVPSVLLREMRMNVRLGGQRFATFMDDRSTFEGIARVMYIEERNERR